MGRIDPGDAAAADDAVVTYLMRLVEVVGHQDRPAFAPRITITMRGGTEYQGEYQGHELEWDLATETARLSPLFDAIPWPQEKLTGLVDAVAGLEQEQRIDRLLGLCVRG